MSGLMRDAFADEGSWIEYNANLARLVAETARMRKVAAYEREWARGTQATRNGALLFRISERERKEQKRLYFRERYRNDAAFRLHVRALTANWRERNPERRREFDRKYRAKRRELRTWEYRQWAMSNKARLRQSWRSYREKNRSILCFRARIYYRTHLEESRLRSREYHAQHRSVLVEKMRVKRAQRPGYKSRESITASSTLFLQDVLSLRGEGWTWAEVAELLGRPRSTCRSIFYQAMKRQRQEQADEAS